MKEFTKQSCTDLRQEINAALASIGQKHGIKIAATNASYSTGFIRFKLELTIDDPTGMSSPEAEAYRQLAEGFGYDKELLGKEVLWNGEQYRVLGLLTRSDKFPILAERLRDGKRYKIKDTAVKLPFEKLYPGGIVEVEPPTRTTKPAL